MYIKAIDVTEKEKGVKIFDFKIMPGEEPSPVKKPSCAESDQQWIERIKSQGKGEVGR